MKGRISRHTNQVIFTWLSFAVVLSSMLASHVAGQEQDQLQIIGDSIRKELRINIYGASEAIPFLEDALNVSRKAKIDRSIEKNDFRLVEVPQSARPNFFHFLVASPNKQTKEAFIAELDSKLVDAVKTCKFRAEPELPVYVLDNPIAAGTAGLLYDDSLKVIKVISETEFLGAYQASRYREEHLFSGWDTSKFSDGTSTKFSYEKAVCPGNKQLSLTNGGALTVLHVMKIDDAALNAAIDLIPVDEYQIAKSRTWRLKDGTVACEGIVVDLDRESIKVQSNDGQILSLAIRDLSNEDGSFVRDQFKRPKPSKSKK